MTGTAQAMETRLPLDFKQFLVTRLFGNAANQMIAVAVGWQMYDLTGQAWDLGLVGLLQFIPALLLTIPAGQLVDSIDRRIVLGASLALQGIVALGLALACGFGWIQRDFILGLSVLLGAARALQMPSQQAIVPTLVSRIQLPRALATSSAMTKFATIGGPALGGLIYAAGAVYVYSVCVVLLAISLGFVARIQPSVSATLREPVTIASMFAGFGYIRSNRVVFGAISLDLFAVILGGATALLPIFAKDILHTGAWGLGILRSAPAVGGLAASMVLAVYPMDRRVGPRMFGAVAVYGLATLVFAGSTNLLLSLAALVAAGAADMVSVVVRHSLVQLETPDAMRGRVSAVNSTFIGASNQLGDFRAGAIAQWLGPVGSVLFGGVGTLLVVALWMKGFPALAKRDRLHGPSG